MTGISTLLICVRIVMDAIHQAVTKCYQKRKPEGMMGYAVYMLTISFSSLLIYGIAAKFQLSINSRTLRYVIFLSVLINVNYVLNLLVLKYTNILTASLFQRSGSMVVVFVFSFFILKETVSVYSVASAILMIIAAMFPAFIKKERKSSGMLGFFLGFLTAISGSLNSIISKLYATDPYTGGSSAAYCFWLNLFMILVWSLYAVWICSSAEHRKEALVVINKFTPKIAGIILINSLVSGIETLVTLYVLSSVDLSYFTVITSSAGIVLTTVMSKAIFKEKLHTSHYISVVLALVAIIIHSL